MDSPRIEKVDTKSPVQATTRAVSSYANNAATATANSRQRTEYGTKETEKLEMLRNAATANGNLRDISRKFAVSLKAKMPRRLKEMETTETIFKKRISDIISRKAP